MRLFDKALKFAGALAVVLAAAGAPALAAPRHEAPMRMAQVTYALHDRDRAPPPRFERMAPMPHKDFVWHKGHWRWDRNQWSWVAGVWRAH